jgi:rubrerythrin
VTDAFKYVNDCPICDIETTIIVHEDDDPPAHCPMCGSDSNLVQLKDSDE